MFIYKTIFNTDTSYKPCHSCLGSIQEARVYIEQLEKRIKSLHDDVARWMKMYTDEISNKISYTERHLINLAELTAKFIALEQKVNSTKK